MVRLQVIGGGKMGEALLVSLASSGWAEADELHVVEPDLARREAIAVAAPGVSVSSEAVSGTDAVIAVKPDVVATVLPGLAAVGVSRALSIAAGGAHRHHRSQLASRNPGGEGHAQHAGAGG